MTSLPYFSELNIRHLRNSTILLDVDGTLLADSESEVAISVREHVAWLKRQGNIIILCTNGFKRKHARNRAIANALDVAYFETTAKKPFRKAAPPEIFTAGRPIVVIGDKFLTDALFAVRLGAPFIEVRTIRSPHDPFVVKLAYAIDDPIERLLTPLVRTRMPAAGITLLTEPPLAVSDFLHRFKRFLRKAARASIFITTRNPRFAAIGGPYAVQKSLRAGLQEIGAAYRFNPWQHAVTPTVGVLQGTETLRWAIEQKRKGFIQTIVAGPNIVVSPADEDNLIKREGIDVIVVPSEWNKRWWLTFDQALNDKTIVWPAGVIDHGEGRQPDGPCIIFSKNANEGLFHRIIETLWTHKLSITVLTYGQFTHHEYLALLKKARMLVYVSESESQGIALHEAWMANVPTLVLNRGYFTYQGSRFEDPTVGAPYLTAECGISFTGEHDFEQKLIEFQEKYETFTPRRYSLAHFTTAISARKYLDIVESAEQKYV